MCTQIISTRRTNCIQFHYLNEMKRRIHKTVKSLLDIEWLSFSVVLLEDKVSQSKATDYQ